MPTDHWKTELMLRQARHRRDSGQKARWNISCQLFGHSDGLDRSNMIVCCQACGIVAPDWAQLNPEAYLRAMAQQLTEVFDYVTETLRSIASNVAVVVAEATP